MYLISPDLYLVQVEPTSEHASTLFTFLEKRETEHAISHRGQTDFSAHQHFVFSHPYRHWFLVKYGGKFIGTVYLTNDNVIGAFVEGEHLTVLGQLLNYVVRTFEPLGGIPSVRSPEFTINLGPKNTKYAKIVEDIGGHLIQRSYVLPKNSLHQDKQ